MIKFHSPSITAIIKSNQKLILGADEANCTGTEPVKTCLNFDNHTLTLNDRNRCTVPNPLILVCLDYQDQLNCSKLHPSPLLCEVDGFETYVTINATCQTGGGSLCDDGIDHEL